MSYSLDKPSETIRYTLARNVDAGEELCISYGSGRMWWETAEEEKPQAIAGAVNGEEEELLNLAGFEAEGSEKEVDDEVEPSVGGSRDSIDFKEKERRRGGHKSGDCDERTGNVVLPNGNMEKMLIKPPDPVGPDAAPLWRITAAIDPNTMPLELMDVWILKIAPRKSEAFLEVIRQRKRAAAAAEEAREQPEIASDQADDEADEEGVRKPRGKRKQGVDDDTYGTMRHLRTFHRITNSRTGKVELCALIGQVDDWSHEEIMTLFGDAQLGDDGQRVEPYVEQVPRYPAPSRERLEEWKAHWPVSVKLGIARPSELPEIPSYDPTATPASPTIMGPEPNMVVDRAGDARSWTPDATEWARQNFVKCINNARRAKAKGELAIGAHVCPAYSRTGSSESPDAIIVDSYDTRKSLRNPLKHAVKNAITSVASIRIARDADRLPTVNAKVALLQRNADVNHRPSSSSSTSSSASSVPLSCHSSFQGLTGSTPRTSSPAPPGRPSVSTTSSSPHKSTDAASLNAKQDKERLANGQEYLLNNLALFTTHEPCLMCCMALVHSRVKAVYFLLPSPRAGGCCGAHLPEGKRCLHAEDGGPYAVQEQAGLNHHFDVWKWVGADEAFAGKPGEEAQKDWKTLLDINGLDP